eukprot:jgi/Tetstr1/458453/TSEL_044888.t1
MAALKEAYESKSKDFQCELIAPAVAQMHEAADSEGVLLSLDLRGNSKDLFNKRIQYMQLFALTEALADDKDIEAIDLSFNFIDDAGGNVARQPSPEEHLSEVPQPSGQQHRQRGRHKAGGGAGIQVRGRC